MEPPMRAAPAHDRAVYRRQQQQRAAAPRSGSAALSAVKRHPRVANSMPPSLHFTTLAVGCSASHCRPRAPRIEGTLTLSTNRFRRGGCPTPFNTSISSEHRHPYHLLTATPSTLPAPHRRPASKLSMRTSQQSIASSRSA
eukprot:6183183-Pleurochrysis_carterae.AAC.1